ncbi:WD domain, G-beta repeat [Polystyrenella longa]|uniref:WD domain, G-beta repeat n=1 Tax=Polystyrenella longa TaxID=2528007 RepID=A0A518CSK3_9PLAN|nr:c-type cytochrome domain-containing protein [Polystyrenella longa]QDU82219.1 WD domain, G-beta repeat [Polystyrenella longa]
MQRFLFCLTSLLFILPVNLTAAEIDYQKQVAPILQKYCVGCHNAEDMEGDLELHTFAAMQKGGTNGPVLVAGKGNESLLVQVLTGNADSVMPPEGSEAPTEKEIALLTAWIDAGAKGPAPGTETIMLNVPQIQPTHSYDDPITSLDWSDDGKWVAVSSYQHVDLLDASSLKPVKSLSDFPGKVNSVSFSNDNRFLVTGSGITGLQGEAALWDIATGEQVQSFTGHQDIIYTARLNPTGDLLATGSYDRQVILWDVKTGEQLRTLSGHNDAIYDLEFSPDGSLLVTASGDTTAKVWNVATGERFDTLGQPLKEVYSVLFSPDGKTVLAAGVDNRIRIWELVSKDKVAINPLLHARFAHLGPILSLAYTPDQTSLVTISEDLSIKQWNAKTLDQIQAFEQQPSICTTVTISPDSQTFIVGRIDGTFQQYSLQQVKDSQAEGTAKDIESLVRREVGEMHELTDLEPNDTPDQAATIELPAKIAGTIYHEGTTDEVDFDLYRFTAKKGEQWITEIKASREESPLDSKVEVLDSEGKPIVRTQLKAVRDSWFTFRGKDSFTSNDFRIQNWEEMELNEYLYANGEIVKLWLYPRGPDSGFRVYPGDGNRFGYFDTTPLAHALQEPCYVVEPYPADVEVVPNGLPIFKLYYENDDESRRQWGSDSKLTFTAPADGDYLVRVSDVRQFQGSDFKYELTVRQPEPDFKVTLKGENPTLKRGTGRELVFSVDREDNFEGPIEIQITDLPPGFISSSPIVIQEGQLQALGTIYAPADVVAPTPENAKLAKVTATALINGESVKHEVNSIGEIKLDEATPKVTMEIIPHAGESAINPEDGLLELTIHPGEMVSAYVRITRNEHEDRVRFGSDDCGRNLPHGVIVDNIGLNGLMIPEGETEQIFTLAASKWLPEQDRLFHLKADADDGLTTLPIRLKVRRNSNLAKND